MKIVIEKSVVPLPGLPLHLPIEVPAGTRIRDLLARHMEGKDAELYLLPSVNGESTNLDRVLHDGDRLHLFRLSAGG
jgi:sulfur carrier protein ThiS